MAAAFHIVSNSFFKIILQYDVT